MPNAWISFEHIKKAVSLEMVINRYGWKLRSTGPSVLRGKCPLPTHRSEESKESFIATLNKGTGGAWSCHSQSCAAGRGGKKGGNTLDLVAAVEQCSIREAALKLKSWFSVPDGNGEHNTHDQEKNIRDAKPESAPLVSEKNGTGDSSVNKPLTFALKSVDPSHPYLKERGLTEETIQTFGVGFFSNRGTMQNRIVIPIHNAASELVAYAGRVIDNAEPRYKFPAGFHKGLEVFNLHRVIGEGRAAHVVIVEGFFDCMNVHQNGFSCVALMGSSMTTAQEEILVSHFKGATLLMDGDEAGRRATDELLLRLGRRMWISAAVIPEGKQPDMLIAQELHALLKK